MSNNNNNRRNNNRVINPLAQKALENFKYETAAELGLINKIKNQGWANMTTRETGKIGGQMVKKMIKHMEDQMAGQPYPEDPLNYPGE